MRRLRIALVCDSFLPHVGGIEVHVDALARQLVRAGHQVDVVTTALGDDGPRPDGVRVRRLGVPILPRFDVAFTPTAFSALRTALLDGAYDLVHCHGSLVSPMAVAGAYFSHAHGVPCVLTHHSVLPHRAVLATLDWLGGWTRWAVVRTAVSALVAGQVRRACPGMVVHVLPNAVDASRWTVAHRRPAPDTFRLASVMRFAARKRPLALLHIVADVAAELRNVAPTRRLVVRVVGDGPPRRMIERRIRRLGLEEIVELRGEQPPAAVRALFADSDVFVTPSVRESFGLAALEARCAGLPIVARRGTGIAGFVRHGHEGLLASSDDDMVRQVLRLATDPALTAAITRHNACTPPAETWGVALERHLAVYRLAIRAFGGRVVPLPAREPTVEATASEAAAVDWAVAARAQSD